MTNNAVSPETSTSRNESKLRKYLCNSENLLVALTITGVVVGIGMGIGIKYHAPEMTPKQIWYFGLPGELFMRMLQLLILPLIASTLINSMASLDQSTAGRLGGFALLYYLFTTVVAAVTGIVLVSLVKPGGGGDDKLANSTGAAIDKCQGTRPEDAIIDIFRNMFPENIVEAAFQSVRTCIEYSIHNGSDVISYKDAMNITDRGDADKLGLVIQPYLVESSGLNVLGIVICSVVFGLMISKHKLSGKVKVLHEAVAEFEFLTMNIVKMVIWVAPLGITFLIAGQILKMKDVEEEMKRLGLYMATVIGGLAIHFFITLHVLLIVFARRNPFKYIAGLVEALLTSFGTSSSSATIPVSLRCLEENNNIDQRVSRLMIPLGATVNMNGTALYEAIAVVFIAQTIGYPLDTGRLVLISITATIVAIGAAGIPQSAMVMMVMILIAVGLPTHLFVLIVPVDWFLDRVRTMVNVYSDCIGAGIVDALCKSYLNQRKVSKIGEIMHEGDEEEKGIENGQIYIEKDEAASIDRF